MGTWTFGVTTGHLNPLSLTMHGLFTVEGFNPGAELYLRPKIDLSLAKRQVEPIIKEASRLEGLHEA